ncbi:glycosyltransferase family 39 protein [Candidatus Bathyarchaeota archaeon]|nr:glycosyltransferase family 39 protein [Candidatus Bathyarchaeota archaeon]
MSLQKIFQRQCFPGILALLLILAFGTLVRVYVYGISGVDDRTYVAACGLILQGYQPYRDFFLAHPPLFFWLIAGLWKLLNLTDPYAMWNVGRCVAILAFLGVTTLVYMITYRVSRSRTAGLIAAALYQFSGHTLYFSVQTTPQLPAIFLSLLSLYLLLIGANLFYVGLTLGLASLTYLSALTVIPAYILYFILRKREGYLSIKGIVFAVIGFILPLISLTVFPAESLWRCLILFHTIKGTGLSITHLTKFVYIVAAEEFPIAVGLAGVVYAWLNPNPKGLLLSSAALLSLIPYFAQPIATAHVLIPAVPLFASLGSIPLPNLLTGGEQKRVVALFILAILIGGTYSTINEFQSVAADLERDKGSINATIRRLVRIVQKYTAPEDMVFSQNPIVPFIAKRPYPLLVDMTLTAEYAGVFTPQTVRKLLLDHQIKLVILLPEFEHELKTFLREQGYVRVERTGLYRIYLRIM